jgi:hypothetical protein
MSVVARRAAIVVSLSLVLPALALPAVLAGCGAGLPPLQSHLAVVQGQGDPVTETRTTPEFRHVSVGGGLEVVASTGSTTSVTVAAQPNLLPLIRTEVANDQLVVTVKEPGFSTSQPATVTIIAPEIDSMTLSGGARGTLEAIGANLAVDVSGGASLDATGRVDTLHLTGSSGAQAHLDHLAAGAAVIDLSGGATADLDVTGSLTGTASGGSTVNLAAKPARIDVKTSGGATVTGG